MPNDTNFFWATFFLFSMTTLNFQQGIALHCEEARNSYLLEDSPLYLRLTLLDCICEVFLEIKSNLPLAKTSSCFSWVRKKLFISVWYSHHSKGEIEADHPFWQFSFSFLLNYEMSRELKGSNFDTKGYLALIQGKQILATIALLLGIYSTLH